MNRLLALALVLVLLVSCDKNDSNCGPSVRIDPAAYQATLTNNFSIRDVTVNGDCLELEISSGGCDGSSWTTRLFDAGLTNQDVPVQRQLRLQLDNKELCQAIITKTVYFDLAKLRVPYSREVNIQLDGWADNIVYRY